VPFPTAFVIEKKTTSSLRTPTKEKEKEKENLWNHAVVPHKKWNSTGAPWSNHNHTLCSSTFIPKMLRAMQDGICKSTTTLLPW